MWRNKGEKMYVPPGHVVWDIAHGFHPPRHHEVILPCASKRTTVSALHSKLSFTPNFSPARMLCSANITAFSPLAQTCGQGMSHRLGLTTHCMMSINQIVCTLFIPVQGTLGGRPARIMACVAGACPRLALQTLPMKTSSTTERGTLPLSRAAASRGGQLMMGPFN